MLAVAGIGGTASLTSMLQVKCRKCDLEQKWHLRGQSFDLQLINMQVKTSLAGAVVMARPGVYTSYDLSLSSAAQFSLKLAAFPSNSSS